MKRFILGLLCAFALAASKANGTESVSFDRAWWDGLSEAEQTTAVQGLIEGFHGGYDAGYRSAAMVVLLDRNPARTHFANLLVRQVHEENRSQVFSKTFGTYVHLVSDFYTNNPGLAKATVGDFFECFADHPQFTCDEQATMLTKVYTNRR